MMDGHKRSVIAVTTSEPYTRAAARDGSSVARDPGGVVGFGQEQPSHPAGPVFGGQTRSGPAPMLSDNANTLAGVTDGW